MIWVVFLSARRFGLKRFDYVTFCFRARRFGLKRFDYVTFCFRICISGFKICEMIVFEVFDHLFSVQMRFPEMVEQFLFLLGPL
jgi:hypothetical protein